MTWTGWSEGRIELWLLGWGLVAGLFLIMWLVETRSEDASLVDATWAASLGFLAILYAFTAEGWTPRRVAVALLVGVWSFRLALHIARRHAAASEEDARYREIREGWGRTAHRFFFFFYQGQALLAALLSVPFLLAAFDPAPSFHGVEVTGWLVAALGMAGESVADAQLARHRNDPARRGKTCRAGLWRYSRHPNYFFEWVVWCGFALVALAAPYGALGLLSPALMLYLIVYVTGIPPAEARALRSRGEDYRRYQETTSAFVPWFPNSEAVA